MSILRVLVTGAGGKTGKIVVRKLTEREDQFQVKALVRSETSAQTVRDYVKKQHLETHIADVTKAGIDNMSMACKDIDAVVICTSAIPQLDYWSLIPLMFNKLYCSVFGGDAGKPQFYYPEGQMPEKVDWEGQKAQIDAAKQAGVKHVVLCSSMGGTQPDHFLNTMGGGNILLWKRKAEVYLMESGMNYTIVHPGGLLPHFGSSQPADGGKRELKVDVDDMMMSSTQKTIPREDVAEVLVQSLVTKEAVNRSFDLASKPEGEGEIFSDLSQLLTGLNGKNCSYDTPELPKTDAETRI